MSVLNVSEIKGWDAKAIDAKVTEMRVEMFNLNMQKVASGIEKPHQLKILKKNVARLLTVKNAKGDK